MPSSYDKAFNVSKIHDIGIGGVLGLSPNETMYYILTKVFSCKKKLIKVGVNR